MSQQLANTGVQRSLKQLLMSESIQEQIKLALPEHMTAERMCRVAITALTKSPTLAQCTPESFMSCMLDLSAMGLEPDGRRAHLIPFKSRDKGTICTLVVDYKGLVELVRRNGDVARIHADVVKENDDFEYNMGEVTKHTYSFKEERGEVVAAYVIIEFKGGSKQCEVMSRKDIEAIMKSSNGYKAAKKFNKASIWDEHFEEMCKKTVFRRATKWVTLSPEINDAFKRMDEAEFRNVTPKQEKLTMPDNPFANDPSLTTSEEQEQQTEQPQTEEEEQKW